MVPDLTIRFFFSRFLFSNFAFFASQKFSREKFFTVRGAQENCSCRSVLYGLLLSKMWEAFHEKRYVGASSGYSLYAQTLGLSLLLKVSSAIRFLMINIVYFNFYAQEIKIFANQKKSF